MAAIGITCGHVLSWKINTRAKTRWGLCRQLSPGCFEIQISARLLEEDVSDQALKDTIVHELLHTIPGCFGHRGKWRSYADHVNAELPAYRIKARTSAEEKGLSIEARPPHFRYILQCRRCGKTIYRQRMSEVVSHPEHYRCTCGGKLGRIL